MLKAVKATGKKLVVVLMNGSALSVNWASNNADALIDAWYPGEEGGTAVAETLAGDRVVAPGGYQISIGEGQPGTGAAGVRGGFTIAGTANLPEQAGLSTVLRAVVHFLEEDEGGRAWLRIRGEGVRFSAR